MVRSEIVFSANDTEMTASVVHPEYPNSAEDFMIELVLDDMEQPVEGGDQLFTKEIRDAFEEQRINGLL